MKDSRLFRVLALSAAALGAFAVGCHGDRSVAPVDGPAEVPTGTPAGAPTRNLSALVPAGSVQSAIQQEPTAADGSITFVVRVMAQGVGVSAYQGAVTFVPGVFQLVSITAPPGRGEEVFAVNPGEFAAGRIRFAACAATTFVGTDVGDGVEAFRFTVRTLGSVASANLASTLSVVGLETGVGLAAERLLASPAVLGTTAAVR